MRLTHRLIVLGWITLIPAAVLLAQPLPAPPEDAPPVVAAPVEPKIEDVLAKLEKITGLARKAPVASRKMNRDEIRAYVLERLREEFDAEDLDQEERIYRVLGLVPPQSDLRRTLVDMYTEQVGGFYDPKSKAYVIADWIDAGLQEPVMAHELVHALQDQYVPVEPVQERLRDNDDASRAYAALLEGSASLAMIAYMMNTPVEETTRLGDISWLMQMAMQQSQDQTPVFAAAPQFLKESMLFPYIRGSEFVRRLLETRKFNTLEQWLVSPPATTEQILNPEKYLAVPPEPALPVSWSVDELLTLGRSDGRSRQGGQMLLQQFLRTGLPKETAEAASAGWGGDSLQLLAAAEGQGGQVAWKIRWDTPAAAARFAAAVGQWPAGPDKPAVQVSTPAPDLTILRIGRSLR